MTESAKRILTNGRNLSAELAARRLEKWKMLANAGLTSLTDPQFTARLRALTFQNHG